MRRAIVSGLMLCAIAAATARAQQPPDHRLDRLPRVASSTATITPIYGELLLFSMPAGFRAVNDADVAGRYLQQSLPNGQNVDRWIEMIAVTGEKDAATSGVSARKLAETIAGSLRQGCPTTFSVASFGAVQVEGHDGFATVIACGNVDPARPASQTVLLVAIRGTRDLYTLQWLERGPPSATALVIDPARWQDRLARIAPVRLCPVVAGEPPPYRSCTGPR